MKYHFSRSAIHITDNSNININIKTKMEVCLKGPLSKNPHHAEANQLTFTKCQMSGLYTTQDITKRSFRTDLKITKTVKIC